MFVLIVFVCVSVCVRVLQLDSFLGLKNSGEFHPDQGMGGVTGDGGNKPQGFPDDGSQGNLPSLVCTDH